MLQLTGNTSGKKQKQACQKLKIQPTTLNFRTLQSDFIITEDQQKYSLKSILIPHELEDDQKRLNLDKCTKNSLDTMGEEDGYTITLTFQERIPPKADFLSSSLTGHMIELSEDRLELLIHLCGSREKETIEFYENILNYNYETSDMYHVVFFMNENSSQINKLQLKDASIKTYKEARNNYFCLVSGYYRILKERLEETENDEEFVPYLELPSKEETEGKELVKVYFRMESSLTIINKIGNSLGYRNSKRLFGNVKDDNAGGTYLLTPSKNRCIPIMNKILKGQRLSQKERKNIRDCYEKSEKKNLRVLKISVKGILSITSLIGQSSCSASGECPLGFSKRKGDECLPRRCKCSNGISAHSSYESMNFFCGTTTEDNNLEDDDDDQIFLEKIQYKVLFF